MRLNKFLAAAGIASRRTSDELIASGAVRVNGIVARPGQSIDPTSDVVLLAGKRIKPSPIGSEPLTVILHKPVGVVSTMRDERGRPSVAALLPNSRQLFPVGRLDAETSGLLICTTDGDLARFLAHPSSGIERRYAVRVAGSLSPEAARRLGARSPRTSRDGATTFELVLKEGKNRQVRRMCAREGLRVVALARTRFGPIALGNLAPGRWRAPSKSERAKLDSMTKAR